MRHPLQEISRTGAATTRRRIIERISVALAAGYFLVVGSENSVAELEKPDPWQNAQLFTKPLDQAVKYGQPINPLTPPLLSVWELIGGSEELTAMADYINLGKKRVTLQGRKIKDTTGDEERFYPYARLEVSDQIDHAWKIIGDSPPQMAGAPVAVTMVPIKIGVANRKAGSNPSCMVDLNPFKKFVGKFRYGRIVLKNGGASQVLGLNDLLPPGYSFDRVKPNVRHPERTLDREQISDASNVIPGQTLALVGGATEARLGSTIDDFRSSWGLPTREETLVRTARVVWRWPDEASAPLPAGIFEAEVSFLDGIACEIVLRSNQRMKKVDLGNLGKALVPSFQVSDLARVKSRSDGTSTYAIRDGGYMTAWCNEKPAVMMIRGGLFLQNRELFDQEAAKVRPPTSNH
jgi:hypothetical protein